MFGMMARITATRITPLAFAKFRIAEDQENDNYFIYNKDDEMSQKLLQQLDLRVKQIPFSMKEKLNEGGYTEGEKLYVHYIS